MTESRDSTFKMQTRVDRFSFSFLVKKTSQDNRTGRGRLRLLFLQDPAHVPQFLSLRLADLGIPEPHRP